MQHMSLHQLDFPLGELSVGGHDSTCELTLGQIRQEVCNSTAAGDPARAIPVTMELCVRLLINWAKSKMSLLRPLVTTGGSKKTSHQHMSHEGDLSSGGLCPEPTTCERKQGCSEESLPVVLPGWEPSK
eukprot:5713769-Amphidinium_carterae.1